MDLDSIALRTIASIAQFLDTDESLDVDFTPLQLSWTTAAGLIYLIHYQRFLRELWVSSPISGAHHFLYDNKCWISTRDSVCRLDTLLNAESFAVTIPSFELD